MTSGLKFIVMFQSLFFSTVLGLFVPKNDTIRVRATNVSKFDKSLSSINPVQNTDFTDEALVSQFNGRVLFKEFFLSKQLFDKGYSESKFQLFIGCKDSLISIGFDENHDGRFEEIEISRMPTNNKRIVTIRIYPRKYCDTSVLLDSSVLHLIPFSYGVHYNDASSVDSMLQLTVSRGFIKEFKLNDTTFLYSHPATFRKDDSNYVGRYILKQPHFQAAIYPQKDLVMIGDDYFDVVFSNEKDVVNLVSVDKGVSFKIKKVSSLSLDSLQLVTLKGKKAKSFVFSKEFIFIDFWATWCKPCIASMPMIDSLYRKEKDRLQIISVCIDSKSRMRLAQKIVSEKKITYEQYFLKSAEYSQNSMLDQFGVIAYPTYILLDKTGKVLNFSNSISEITF